MKSGSDYEKYPFGVLQKTYVRVTKSQINFTKGLCMNIECNKPVSGQKEYCSSKCYDKVKYERSVASSWI